MANFSQQNGPSFGEMKPYSPDYGFLMQVYGTRQAEYDRGFDAVKSLYTSQLNSALTNNDNEAHRGEVFKKIQSSLRSVAGVDLSQAKNISSANALIDPISTDKDLAYDMGFTSYTQKQKTIMNQYKNSTDFKMRSLYSPESEEDIQNAENDLRAAKRGDGSMQQVRPRDFTPVEDTNDYLRKAAKEEGLKISFDSAGGGYMKTSVNGPNSYAAFNQWAKTTLGNKFDRQFAMQGRVQAERMIRGTMAQAGVGRNDAIKLVATKLTAVMQEKTAVKGVKATEVLNEYEEEIEQFKKNYPDGIPASKQDYYAKLLADRDAHEQEAEGAKHESQQLSTAGADYVAGNIHSLFAKEAKAQAAGTWAKSHADATAEVSLRPDEVYLTKARIASEQALTRMRIASSEKIAGAQLQQSAYQFGITSKQKDLALEMEGYKIANAAGGTGAGKAGKAGAAGTEEYMGEFMTDAKSSGVLVSKAGMAKTRNDIFRTAFGKTDGLINTFMTGNAAVQTYAVLTKIQNMEHGSGAKLTDADKKVLGIFAQKLGVSVAIPQNAGQSSELLKQLAVRTNNKAVKLLKTNAGQGVTNADAKIYDAFKSNAASFAKYSQANDVYEADNAKIARAIMTRAGQVKEAYRDVVKIVGRTDKGTPIFDFSKAPADVQATFSNFVNKEHNMKTRASGSLIQFNNITGAELWNVLSPNSGIAVVDDAGNKVDTSGLVKNSPSALKELFGNAMVVGYSPIDKMVTVKLNQDVTSGLAKAQKLKTAGQLTVQIPYSTLMKNPAMARLAKHITTNSVNPESQGSLADFASNDYATVSAPSYMAAGGFDYMAGGGTNAAGQYGIDVSYTIFNPQTGQDLSMTEFFAKDPSNPDFIGNVNDVLSKKHMEYITKRAAYEKAANANQQLLPY